MNVNNTHARLTAAGAAWQAMLHEDKTARVIQTVAAMTSLVHNAAATSASVRDITDEFIAEAAERKLSGEAALGLLWQWLKVKQKHRDDPPGVEFVTHPDILARQAINLGQFSGDCDDVAVLGATIAALMGFKSIDFVVIAREGREWEHVYFRVMVDRTWYAIDPQETDRPFHEREHARRLDFPVWRT
jgi:hypothetical protein